MHIAEKLPRILTKIDSSAIMSIRSDDPLIVSMQYFGKPNFHKQHTAGLKKTIISLETRISEHEQKIISPESFYPDWAELDDRQKTGFKNHWEKEITNFRSQLEEARKELASRGEEDE